ncbi:MAG: division/cell wall cluster transcriptional repressor MraZ, partial [bacterium]|nr:division/cell wall cluster transcriptional repressor MraZ [bacterium]
MFLGEYQHTIDEKGRMAVPVKFRHDVESGAVVTRGIDKCLFLLPKAEWEKLAEKIVNLPSGQANSRTFSRHMFANAMDVELDKQGRVILPDYLREYAGVKKNVVVAGLYNRIEIWDAGTWEKYKETTEKG